MKRLTKTYQDGTYGVADACRCTENSHSFKKMLIDRLGSFEDPQEGKNHFDAWGDKIPEKTRCVEYDAQTVYKFVNEDTSNYLTADQFRALANVQLEVYRMLIDMKNKEGEVK